MALEDLTTKANSWPWRAEPGRGSADVVLGSIQALAVPGGARRAPSPSRPVAHLENGSWKGIQLSGLLGV